MSKMSLTSLIAEMHGKSLTCGWDAVVLYDQRKTNELLLQLYIERVNSENGYIEPMSMVAPWGEDAYKEYIHDLKLSAPRLSFENADPKLPAKTRLTMDMIGGMIVSAKKPPGGPFYISKLLKILPVGGPQLWMDQPVTKAQVNGLGEVLIDLANANNFKANFVLGELSMEKVGIRFKEYFQENIPADKKVFPLGRLDGELNGALTPQNFEVRLMKSAPNALMGDEQYGEGAVMLFITLKGGRDSSRFPDAQSPYLIPADGGGGKYTGTLLISNKVLVESILKPALESSIGKGLELTIIDKGQDLASTLQATAGGSQVGFDTTMYSYWYAPTQSQSFTNSRLEPFAYQFKWDVNAPSGLSLFYGAKGNLYIQWLASVSGQCKVPARNPDHDFGYQCKHWLQVLLEANVDPTSNHVALNNPIIEIIQTRVTFNGSAGHYWNEDGEAETKRHISDRVQFAIGGVIDNIQIPSIDVFTLRNLLFPGHNALHLTKAFVPGDLALFGEIDPLRTSAKLSPLNSTVEAGSGFQFDLTPMPSNVTWSARDIDGRVSLPEVISSSGYFTAPSQSQMPEGFLAIVVTARGTLDGAPVQSSALVSVLGSMVLTNPLYDSCDPGETKQLTAESLDGGALEWNILTPQWGSSLTPVSGEPTKRTYTAGGSSDRYTPFSLDKIEVRQTSNGQVGYIHVLIQNQAVTTPLRISEASDPDNGTVQFELRGTHGPVDPSRVTWKLLGGPGTFDESTGSYREPASVAPGSFIVVSGMVPDEFQDMLAVAAIPLPLSKYVELLEILNETVPPVDSSLPIPGNFRLEHNNYYPIQFQWSASNNAVKYRLYRWWVPIADITGTEYTSSVQGYNRFHLRAVDAAGQLSERTPYVYFYPPGYLSSEPGRSAGSGDEGG
ncbi:hypothetical protein SAMN03159443_03947 [Pseudomonas sp. NFACC15-1]|uniref:hypothetical protein n=1 Tax=unclassified Pseudomonas TaxID=196821 RepID=UPI00088B256C|nr:MULTISPECIES: hypothetical protein [unclassified Pseudomonas]SDA87162.1 hypothetical protein SAMN03159443_03947 [Pseudomonas sp. NFACC15-1]SDY78283.1 hypothetical protein SAMN03159380_04697 [Pseudomonas sp. NFACC14]